MRSLANLLGFHIHRLLENVRKVRGIEKTAFLRDERYGFVCCGEHISCVRNTNFFQIFHRRGVKNFFKIPEKVGRGHIYYFR